MGRRLARSSPHAAVAVLVAGLLFALAEPAAPQVLCDLDAA